MDMGLCLAHRPAVLALPTRKPSTDAPHKLPGLVIGTRCEAALFGLNSL